MAYSLHIFCIIFCIFDAYLMHIYRYCMHIYLCILNAYLMHIYANFMHIFRIFVILKSM